MLGVNSDLFSWCLSPSSIPPPHSCSIHLNKTKQKKTKNAIWMLAFSSWGWLVWKLDLLWFGGGKAGGDLKLINPCEVIFPERRAEAAPINSSWESDDDDDAAVLTPWEMRVKRHICSAVASQIPKWYEKVCKMARSKLHESSILSRRTRGCPARLSAIPGRSAVEPFAKTCSNVVVCNLATCHSGWRRIFLANPAVILIVGGLVWILPCPVNCTAVPFFVAPS